MHVVLQMDRHVRVPEVGERWWVLVPEYRHKGKLDVVWCGPYKVLEVLNKGENVKLDIPAPFLTHVNTSAGSFGFDEIHNGMYRGLMQLRSADCGLHRVEKLRVAARRPARVVVVSPTSSGSRSQYVQTDRCRPTQSKGKKH